MFLWNCSIRKREKKTKERKREKNVFFSVWIAKRWWPQAFLRLACELHHHLNGDKGDVRLNLLIHFTCNLSYYPRWNSTAFTDVRTYALHMPTQSVIHEMCKTNKATSKPSHPTQDLPNILSIDFSPYVLHNKENKIKYSILRMGMKATTEFSTILYTLQILGDAKTCRRHERVRVLDATYNSVCIVFARNI